MSLCLLTSSVACVRLWTDFLNRVKETALKISDSYGLKYLEMKKNHLHEVFFESLR